MCVNWNKLRLWQGVSLFCLSVILSGCAGVGGVWTGAMLIYDRHNVYKKMDDYRLGADANRRLFSNDRLRCEGCAIDLAVFHRDVLLTGHVPTIGLREEANTRLARLEGIRKMYNQLAIRSTSDHTLQDSWITAKIRSQIIADAAIDPGQFKIVTADGIVYVMGDMMPGQAARVLQIARETDGVLRVVKLFNVYRISAN